jgi:Na+/H+ antiporter NhaC
MYIIIIDLHFVNYTHLNFDMYVKNNNSKNILLQNMKLKIHFLFKIIKTLKIITSTFFIYFEIK